MSKTTSESHTNMPTNLFSTSPHVDKSASTDAMDRGEDTYSLSRDCLDTVIEISDALGPGMTPTDPSKASHITIEDSVRTTPLDYYIKLAGPPGTVQPNEPIFRTSPGSSVPTLRSNRQNRVLLFPGSFNPPHLGHAALLWHTYLCTDDKTIAAIVFPLDAEALSCKDGTEVNGKKFMLSKYQRVQLWQDTALRHFTWIYPAEDLDEHENFLASIKTAAEQDGYEITFPTLYGGDHFDQHGSGWGDKSEIGSDIARPVDAVRGNYDEVEFVTGEKWRKVARADGQVHIGGSEPCTSCWPCRKLRAVYPGINELTRANSRLASGDIFEILYRCQASKGSIWWGKQFRKRDGHKIFIPGGRRYTDKVIRIESGNCANYVFEELEESKNRGLKVLSLIHI